MGIEVILVLIILWMIVTLLGHGTWVVLAAIFGKGRPPTEHVPLDRQGALGALKRQLAQLSELESLDAESVSAIRAAIQTQEERLAASARAAVVPQTAVVPPTDDVQLEEVFPETAPAEPIAPAASAVFEPVAPKVEPVTPAERVRAYAASRVSAMESRAAEPPPPAPPKQREALSRLFAAFMEEKNIRWGELVGGLLIVGCSLALVISFWAEIAENPLLKFGLLGGVTAALFLVGLYTDRRWKIHNTSHGILVIATLLVPLNFLAIAAFTQGAAANDALTLAGESLSAIVFVALVYMAGKSLVPDAAVPLAASVMVPSLVQLAVRRWAEPAAPLTTLYLLAGVAIACYVVTTMLAVRRRAAEVEFEETGANRLFTFLGLASAATFLPLALLAWRVPPAMTTVHWLSPLVVWCGVPALVCGLLFWRRMTGRALSGVQTAGLAVGVLGALVMVAAVFAAWPDPATLLPVAAMNFVALTAVAIWFGIPAAHLPAGLMLVAMWLISIYVGRGDVGWTLDSYQPLARLLVSAESGRMLVPLVVALGCVAGLFRRSGRRDDGIMYAIVAMIATVASLALVLWFGFGRAGDPENIVWALGLYAIAALVAGMLIDRPAVVWIGPALLLAALWQAIEFRWPVALGLELPRVTALLTHASLLVIGAAVLVYVGRGQAHLKVALEVWAAFTSAVAAVLVIVAVPETATGWLAIYAAWVAAVWLTLALLRGWIVVFVASQLATVLAIFAGVTAAVETRDWYAAAVHPWLDPWFLTGQGVALTGYVVILGLARWGVARVAAERAENVIEVPAPPWLARCERLLAAAWPGVDQVLQVLLIGAFLAIAIYAVVPGVAQELAPLAAARGTAPAVRVVTPIENYEIAGIAHAHAAGREAWFMGAALVATILVSMRRQRHLEWFAIALVLVLAMVCPLLSARWEPDVAVASAIRWISAGLFLVASIALWIAARRGGWWPDGIRVELVRNLLVALVVLVYVAFGIYVAASALRIGGVAGGIDQWLTWAVGWAIAAGILGLVWPALTDWSAATGSGTGGLKAAPRQDAIRNALLMLAFCPLAVMCAFAVAKALDQHPIVGPDPASWFRRIGWDVTYGVPLALIALTFVGHAIRDRSSGFAFSAGLLANVVATIVVLMRLARGGGGLDATAWVIIAQVNAIVAGVVALVWLAAVRRRQARVPGLLETQIALAAAFSGACLLPAAIRLAAEPASGEAWLVQAGSMAGWVALALAAAATAWRGWREKREESIVLTSIDDGQDHVTVVWSKVAEPILAYFFAALVAIVAFTALRWDTGDWLAFHTLVVGLAVAAWLLPIVTWAANRVIGNATDAPTPITWSSIASRVLGAMSVGLAVRALYGDPAALWWTIGVLAAISARNIWIAWAEGSRGSMWIAAVLANVAVSLWWIDQGNRLTATRGNGELYEFLWVNVIASAVLAVVSAWIEPRAKASSRWVAFHRVAAWAIVGVLGLAAVNRIAGDLNGMRIEATAGLNWAAWLAAVVAAVACWWDPRSRWPVACMYLVGLVAVGIFLDGFDFPEPKFQWALALALAAYSLATSFVWSRRAEIAAVLARLRVPATSQAADGHAWLVTVNGLSAAAVVALVAWLEVTLPEFRLRMIVSWAVLAEVVAIALLARGAVRSPLQYASLVLGVLFGVAFAWAWLAPDMPAPWLHRMVAAIAALAAAMAVYGLGLVKLLRKENEWTRAAQRLVPVLAVVAGVLLIAVLVVEVLAYVNEEPVPITMPALLAVAIALVGLALAALTAAIVRGRDPLGMSERGRTAYVYAAEILLALAFLHIRVTMPWLFSGWFARFWPLVVMAIAFVGVGLSEFFQRRRQNVLAEPLATTGALLPLLPALGFWAASSEVDYSLVLLAVGTLYAALSALRRSFGYAVLAALAANGSLWYLLHNRAGVSIAEHPQLWLIPPALCVLAAGYINRARLSAEQSAALRYGSAIVIYASSTADVFINGVADAPWLPAVLAGLSILGVFAGILLRVRAFLYLGVTFLTVALLTVIWYAAIEQERTWIMWVAGIVTGVLILALLGILEKRRDDVLRVVERLKQWEA